MVQREIEDAELRYALGESYRDIALVLRVPAWLVEYWLTADFKWWER
jgi:hypothetical protein